MTNRTTIRQVAQRAGVSRTTVSNVLLGRHENVAEDTRNLVLQLVREMDYIPIRPALQNRHTPTRMIAVPVDDPNRLQWGINSGTYLGVCSAAMRLGYDIALLLRSDPDWASDRGEVQFLDRRTDGVIFASPLIGETDKTYHALVRHNIPAVVCYRRDAPKGIAWVDPDNQAAMYAVVNHLVENGHTRIAYATTGVNAKDFDKVERLKYFLDALRTHGLECGEERAFELHYFDTTPDQIRHIIDAGYTALVCINDLLAVNLMMVMKSAGIPVPDALSITGMDGEGAEEHGLTSVEFSIFDVGYKAVEAIAEVIAGRSPEESCRVVPVHLVSRNTVKRLN